MTVALSRQDKFLLAFVAALASIGLVLTFPAAAARAQGPTPKPFPFAKVDKETLTRGQMLWKRECLQCHGEDGSANTPTALLLKPRPRDFTLGAVKFKTTSRESLPLKVDLARTIREGVPGTAMASFAHLNETDVEALAAWTEHLLLLGLQQRVDASYQASGVAPMPSVEFYWNHARKNLISTTTPKTPTSKESVERGRDLFLGPKGNCWSCHGNDGAGKGPVSFDAHQQEYLLSDSWGNEIRLADLNLGQFRGGNQPEQLWHRIQQGVAGTPMPNMTHKLSAKEIWDLVNFLLAEFSE